ncbi:MAG: hypothetical protein ACK4XY_09140 [Chloroherpetonaceae bacterium]
MRVKLLVGLLIGLLCSSCGSETGPSEKASVTFPTSTTFTLRYADFIDTTGTGRNYDSIGVVEERIVGTRTLSGRTAFLHENRLITADTTTVDTTFHAYDNNNQDQWIFLSSIEDFVGNLGGFNLQGFPSGWYPYLKTTETVGRNYTILPPTQLTLQIDTLTINATIRAVGNVRGKETITVQGRSYNTIKIVLTFTLQARLLGLTLPEAEIQQQVWCGDNIGIVKFETTSATIGLPPFFSFTTPNAKQELISITNTSAPAN